jgi:hypothetical protein
LPASGNAPVRFTDPVTQREYVLLPAETYDRLQAVLEDGLDMQQVGALVEANAREEDIGDPLLEIYQEDRNSP